MNMFGCPWQSIGVGLLRAISIGYYLRGDDTLANERVDMWSPTINGYNRRQ